MRRPVNSPYTITTNHGDYVGTNAKFLYHSGYDYAVPLNRQTYAPISGKIAFAGWSTTGGNMVTLFDGVFYHRMMHHQSLDVANGQHVNEGDWIGKAGTTGLSTGVHVHWDICNKLVATAFSDFIDNDPWLKGEYNHLYNQGLLGYQRVVGTSGVNERTSPNLVGTIVVEWPAGEVLDFKGYVKGESYNGNDIWFVGRYNGRFFWSGAFTDSSTNNLVDLTAPPVVIPPTPTPEPIPPTPEPTPTPPAMFPPDSPLVKEVFPSPNFEEGNINVECIIIHQWDDPAKNPTFEGVKALFLKEDSISPHYTLSPNGDIHQFVKESNRAYHAGPNGNGIGLGIEISPNGGDDMYARGRELVADIRRRYGKNLPLRGHNEFMATLCPKYIDMAKLEPVTPVPPVDDARLDKVEEFLTKTFKEF